MGRRDTRPRANNIDTMNLILSDESDSHEYFGTLIKSMRMIVEMVTPF